MSDEPEELDVVFRLRRQLTQDVTRELLNEAAAEIEDEREIGQELGREIIDLQASWLAERELSTRLYEALGLMFADMDARCHFDTGELAEIESALAAFRGARGTHE